MESTLGKGGVISDKDENIITSPEKKTKNEISRNILKPTSEQTKCKYCFKCITLKNKTRHEQFCPKNNSRVTFVCENCNVEFTRKYNLKFHLSKCSNAIKAMAKIVCLYEGCYNKFWRKLGLIQHLRNKHQYDIKEPVDMTFSNMIDFENWKDEEEKNTFSYFSKHSGTMKNKTNDTIYLYCQHDGKNRDSRPNYNAKTSRKRHYGRVKNNKTCLAMMRLKTEADGSYSLKYFPTHSHPLSVENLKYQPQSNTTYKFIDEQIALGVSPTKIVQNLRLSNGSEGDRTKMTRLQLLSRNLVRQRALKKKLALQYVDEGASSIPTFSKVLRDEELNKSDHTNSLTIPNENVKEISHNKWIVRAEQNVFYYVSRIKERCFYDHCFVKSPLVSCKNLCSHLYVCSCLEPNPLCEHVHKVHLMETHSLPVKSSELNAQTCFTEDRCDYQNSHSQSVEMCRTKLDYLRSMISCKLSPALLSYISSTVDDLIQKCEPWRDSGDPPTKKKPNTHNSSRQKLKIQATKVRKLVKPKKKSPLKKAHQLTSSLKKKENTENLTLLELKVPFLTLFYSGEETFSSL